MIYITAALHSFLRYQNDRVLLLQTAFICVLSTFLCLSILKTKTKPPLVWLHTILFWWQKLPKPCYFQLILNSDEKIRWLTQHWALYFPQYLLFPNTFLLQHKLVSFTLNRSISHLCLSFPFLLHFLFSTIRTRTPSASLHIKFKILLSLSS